MGAGYKVVRMWAEAAIIDVSLEFWADAKVFTLTFFDQVREKNIIIYTSTIQACANTGEWKKAVELFFELEENLITKSRDVIFLVEEVGKIFELREPGSSTSTKSMNEDHVTKNDLFLFRVCMSGRKGVLFYTISSEQF